VVLILDEVKNPPFAMTDRASKRAALLDAPPQRQERQRNRH